MTFNKVFDQQHRNPSNYLSFVMLLQDINLFFKDQLPKLRL